MKKQKEIPTLTGAIVIMVSAIVLFGGVFACQHYLTSKLIHKNDIIKARAITPAFNQGSAFWLI
jgi:hypothetical protein